MTQLVLYSITNGVILQWQDTSVFSYSTAPTGTATLEVTADQWANQSTPQYVSNGVLTGGTAPVAPPPAPSLATQAARASIAGLTIASTGPTLTLADTLFPTDLTTQSILNTLVNGLNTLGSFPGGATTYPMKDSAGIWHTLTESQYKAIAGAIFTYVSTLDLIAAGNPLNATALPLSSVSISV